MNITRKSRIEVARYRRLLALCLLLAVLLSPAAVARAGRAHWGREAVRNSAFPLNDLSPSQAPVAVDDSGPGFTTDEDHFTYTANMLANDSDPAHDALSVLSFDASTRQILW